MSDEHLLLFRKILNIRNYSDSTFKNYNNALIQFNKWNKSDEKLSKDLLFKYVEYLRAHDISYSYMKNSIMALNLFSDLIRGFSQKNDLLKSIKGIGNNFIKSYPKLI